eukprot:scaffold86674_cov66-Phaeocystis_antarctica.AAC.1
MTFTRRKPYQLSRWTSLGRSSFSRMDGWAGCRIGMTRLSLSKPPRCGSLPSETSSEGRLCSRRRQGTRDSIGAGCSPAVYSYPRRRGKRGDGVRVMQTIAVGAFTSSPSGTCFRF